MLRAKASTVGSAMRRLLAQAKEFFGVKRAVSTVEYALIVVAVIAIVGVGAGLLGGGFKDLFTNLAKDVKAAPAAVTKKVTP